MAGLSWLDRLPWAQDSWWQAVLVRTQRDEGAWTSSVPAADATFPPLPASWTLWLPLAVGLVLVVVPPLWRRVRVVVTLAHELGHAGVGMLVGRRFTGFVVRSDMSGHAVTVGKPRGAGLVWTTWAGYPAPALLALGLVAAALTGWAPLLLGLTALVCLLCLLFVRSWATAGVTLAVGLTSGALWWWRSDGRSSAVLLAVAAVLLLGAWRHVAAIARVPRDSDPAVLVRLTRWPGWFWVGTQVLTIAAASAGAAWLLWRAWP